MTPRAETSPTDLADRLSMLEAIHSKELAAFRWRNVHRRIPAKTLKGVAEVVASCCGITMEKMRAKGREQWRCGPRMLAMYLQKKQTGATFQAIQLWWGIKDHGTVVHACKRVKMRMDVELEYRGFVAEVEGRMSCP